MNVPNAAMRGAHSLIQAEAGRRLGKSVAQQLAIGILSGAFPPGHMFPGEIEFADQIGISRSALREAFRALAAKGLVNSRPKAGTHVAPRRQWSLLDPDMLAWQFEAEPDVKFLRDLFELRMMVEPAAAALAATRRSDAESEAMSLNLDQMSAHGLSTNEGRLADQRFHMILLEATRNDVVIALASSIMAAIAWTTLYKQRKSTQPRDPMPEHRALFDAVTAGDPDEARARMEDLIRLALADTELALRD